ncbi:MAG: flavoredoxin [Deltaproteobacteria bacterium HGW-Deltaproteobacteria-20]|nr:MAG: flavoredoxin [Deltaproteobacteria bacterium HGW-Deltaproteobacteria-20]
MKKSMGAKTLLYPTPVLVVGSYDAEARPNVMTAAWGGIACSRPPCITVSLRAATASHGNITARKAFTVSLPARDHAAQADYFGLVSGHDVDKFAATGLTPVAAEFVDAPSIAEFPLVVECELVQVHELGLHTQFIGEVKDVKVDERCLDEEGRLDIRRLDPIACALGDAAAGYYALGELLGGAYSIGKPLIADADS